MNAKLNKDNKIYSIEELKGIMNIIAKNYPIKKIILFGSYAKNIADENSDIDLVVDTNGELKGLSFFGLLSDLNNILKKEVDLIDSREIIVDGKISDEIKRTGIILYEK
ncbi:putative nucleotidyltransferase [Bacilli bacterium PM5-9]|nr:putative nucleotidyltransferase [Bacilli bacterium PM5-9]